MTPSLPFLYRTYGLWNARAFASRLPNVEIRLTRARSYAGMFRSTTRIAPDGSRLSTHLILISAFTDADADAITDVLLHEMIHLAIHLSGRKDTSPHGPLFRSMMDDINTRFGRHITVRTKLTTDTRFSSDVRRQRLLMVCRMEDGETLICCPAVRAWPTVFRTFAYMRNLKNISLYVSMHPSLNIYPEVRTPKLYAIDDTLLSEIIGRSVSLIIDKNGHLRPA